MLGEKLWDLENICLRGAPWSYPLRQFEEETIRLIHGMTRRAIAGALYLTYQQGRHSKASSLVDRLRSVTAEGTHSLPLTGLHDLDAVSKTPPFDVLLKRPSSEVRWRGTVPSRGPY